MSIINKLDPELIFIHEGTTERVELFQKVNRVLRSKGIVTEGYLDAVIARENDHPTAMQLVSMGVAIPHVDTEFVHEERLVVVTSPDGFVFKSAEDDDETLTVNVVFFLLLKNKDAHLQFLMKLIGLFQQTEKMEQLLSTESTAEVIALLSANLEA